jgi:penicillin-binding protein 2
MLIPSPQWKKNHFYESWTQGDTANLAIGQGFLRVTPLQMACFAASLSREETFTRPTLKKTENPVSAYVKQPLGLKKEDYQLLLGSMESSVEEGTSRFTYIKDIRIAGKSGTSQVKVKNASHILTYWLVYWVCLLKKHKSHWQ